MSATLGIDAGGTKTALLVRTSRGERAHSAPGVHALRDGTEAAANALADAVREATDGDALGSVCAGVAGVGREDDRRELEAALTSRLEAAHVRVVSDAEIALHAAWGDESGAVLVVGTGSVMFARDHSGALSRAGGWGGRLGDDGGGGSLGRAALRIALGAHDGGPPSALTDALADDGLPTADDLRRAIYVEGRPLASFAPVLLRAADAGDWQAEQALMRETNTLGQQVGWLATRLGDTVEHRLALVGGLTNEPPYRARLDSALERHLPGWAVSLCERQPVEGALAMAGVRT